MTNTYPQSSSGGATPGGSSGQLQYNNAGSLGGISEGSANQVLTSNGAGVAPSFQAAAGGTTSPFLINNDVDVTTIANWGVTDIKVDPSGTYIYSVGTDTPARDWYLARTKISDGTTTTLNLGITATQLRHIAMQPDGAQLFVFGTTTTVKKINLSTFTVASTITLNFAPNNVLAYDISPDSSLLVFGSGSGGTAKILKINTSTNVETDVNISGHSVTGNVKCICFYLGSNTNLAIQGTGNIDLVDTSGTYSSSITATNQYIQLRSGNLNSDGALVGIGDSNNWTTWWQNGVKQGGSEFRFAPLGNNDVYYMTTGGNSAPCFMYCDSFTGPTVFGWNGYCFSPRMPFTLVNGINSIYACSGPVPNSNNNGGGYCCYAANGSDRLQISKVNLEVNVGTDLSQNTTTSGSVSGTIYVKALENSPNHKKVMIVMNSFNDAGTLFNLGVAFKVVNAITANTTGVTPSSLTLTQITLPNTGGAKTGVIIIEGF